MIGQGKAGHVGKISPDVVVRNQTAAEIGVDHRQDRYVVPCFEQNIGFETGFLKDFVRQASHGRPLIHEDERFVDEPTEVHDGKRLPGRCSLSTKGVPFGDYQKNLFLKQRNIFVIGAVLRT